MDKYLNKQKYNESVAVVRSNKLEVTDENIQAEYLKRGGKLAEFVKIVEKTVEKKVGGKKKK